MNHVLHVTFFPVDKPFFYVLQNTCLKIGFLGCYNVYGIIRSANDAERVALLTDILGWCLAWNVHPDGRPFQTARYLPTSTRCLPMKTDKTESGSPDTMLVGKRAL